jgi:hypothetical protein
LVVAGRIAKILSRSEAFGAKIKAVSKLTRESRKLRSFRAKCTRSGASGKWPLYEPYVKSRNKKKKQKRRRVGKRKRKKKKKEEEEEEEKWREADRRRKRDRLR